jgi:hypothetical protein
MPLLETVGSGAARAFGLNSFTLGTQSNPAVSAVQLVQAGIVQDGPYWIKASASAPAQQVYCVLDPTWDGGGWMILAHNDATQVVYTSSHIPRLTANPAYVGTSGANSYNFSSKWSINAQDMQISKIAWCAYGVGSTAISSWARSSNVVTVNTSTNHNFVVGSPVRIEGSVNPATGVDTINGQNVVISIPSSTSFTINSTGSDVSVTPSSLGYSLTSLSIASNVITFTTSSTHTYIVGDVVQISGLSALYNASYTIRAVTSNTFTVNTPNPNIDPTSISGSVTRSPKVTGIDLNRNIKNIATYHYGQFSTPKNIPATTTRNWTRIYDTFDQPLPWKSINDMLVTSATYARTDFKHYFDAIYLYDGLPDTRNYTASQSYNPLTSLALKAPNSAAPALTSTNNDTTSDGAHGMFSWADRGLVGDPATMAPDGTGGPENFHIRGLDDFQDGNSLGNLWGSASGLLRYGHGAPSFIMVK